jgi:PKHD-type hydroxylase
VLSHIAEVLTPDQLNHARQLLDKAQWVDGAVTAGYQAAHTKNNMQIAEDDPAGRALGEMILGALQSNLQFISAALPLKIFPPRFNRYESGHAFGNHVDNAIRHVRGTAHRVRTDLSVTLFLAPPDQYEGGELWIEDTYGVHKVKLPAGDLILYPASSLHRVTPVISGVRLASFFWIQSMVRDDSARTLLFDLDSSIQQITRDFDTYHPAVAQLTSIYHNLLRRWADV